MRKRRTSHDRELGMDRAISRRDFLQGVAQGGAAFDPAVDITGITVNRWPHGYAPENNSLFEALDR